MSQVSTTANTTFVDSEAVDKAKVRNLFSVIDTELEALERASHETKSELAREADLTERLLRAIYNRNRLPYQIAFGLRSM